MSNILPYLKKNKLNIILTLLLVFSPLILVFFAYQYANVNFSSFSPCWSDEIAHYQTIKALLEYGEPLGYCGYNGTHAPFGSCIWPALRECGFVLYGLCFGFDFPSALIANILFLCFANLIFAILAKPSSKQLAMLVVFNLTSYCFLYYSSSCMSECFFYALAIVICGILYRLHKHPTGVFFRYFIAPLFILFSAFVYTPFGIFMFAYCLIIFKRMPFLKNFFLSAFFTIVSVGLAYVFFKFTFSPYPTEWSIPFSSEHFAAMRRFLFEQSVYISNLRSPVFTFTCISLLILGIFCFLVFLRMIKKKDARLSEMFCFSLLFYGYCVALFIMYPHDSLWRSLTIMLFFAIYALVLILPEKKMFCILLCIALIGFLLGFRDCIRNIISHDVENNYNMTYAEEEKALYEKWFKIDPTKNKWQNTVICVSFKTLFLPTGTGTNFILDIEKGIPLNFEKAISKEAGYALVECNPPFSSPTYHDICILLTEAGFVEVHKDDIRSIFVNSRYQ